MTRRHAAGDGGALGADEDEVFVHSFYWDVLQNPALTVQVRASLAMVVQFSASHGTPDAHHSPRCVFSIVCSQREHCVRSYRRL